MAPKEIRELRNLTRYRKRQIEERAEEVQRLEKVLQEAGIKLSSVATRVLGASGRAMIEALLSGTTDPEVLAELAKGRLRSKIEGAQRGPRRELFFSPRLHGREHIGAHRLPGGVHSAP